MTESMISNMAYGIPLFYSDSHFSDTFEINSHILKL